MSTKLAVLAQEQARGLGHGAEESSQGAQEQGHVWAIDPGKLAQSWLNVSHMKMRAEDSHGVGRCRLTPS